MTHTGEYPLVPALDTGYRQTLRLYIYSLRVDAVLSPYLAILSLIMNVGNMDIIFLDTCLYYETNNTEKGIYKVH